MSFAIVTKYLAPTDTKGARISARFLVGGGRVCIPFAYELDSEGRHRLAAEALIKKFNPDLAVTASADADCGFVFIAK